MTLFFDSHISPKIAQMLRIWGQDARHISEEFPAGTTDAVWLAQIAARNWVFLTADRRITRRRQEKQALIASGARGFFIRSGFSHFTPEEQVVYIFKHLVAIQRRAASLNSGELYDLKLNGQMVRVQLR